MIDMNYDRAEVFMDKKIKAHIQKKSGTYYNGYITEISADFFFIDDQVEGTKLVFFKELKKPIETYTRVIE